VFGGVAVTAAAGVMLLFRVAGLDVDGLVAPAIVDSGGSLSVQAVPNSSGEKRGSASWTEAVAAQRRATSEAEAEGSETASPPAPSKPSADASLLGLGSENGGLAAPEEEASPGERDEPAAPAPEPPENAATGEALPPPAPPVAEPPQVEDPPAELLPALPASEPGRELENREPDLDEPPAPVPVEPPPAQAPVEKPPDDPADPHDQISELRDEIDAVKVELHAELDTLRSELEGVPADERAQIRHEMHDLRAEAKEEKQQLRQEIKELRQEAKE
jgi:hypothetical protein